MIGIALLRWARNDHGSERVRIHGSESEELASCPFLISTRAHPISRWPNIYSKQKHNWSWEASRSDVRVRHIMASCLLSHHFHTDVIRPFSGNAQFTIVLISEMKRGDEHQTDFGSPSLESENEAKRRGTKISLTRSTSVIENIWMPTVCGPVFCRLRVRSRVSRPGPSAGSGPGTTYLCAAGAVLTDFGQPMALGAPGEERGGSGTGN